MGLKLYYWHDSSMEAYLRSLPRDSAGHRMYLEAKDSGRGLDDVAEIYDTINSVPSNTKDFLINLICEI